MGLADGALDAGVIAQLLLLAGLAAAVAAFVLPVLRRRGPGGARAPREDPRTDAAASALRLDADGDAGGWGAAPGGGDAGGDGGD